MKKMKITNKKTNEQLSGGDDIVAHICHDNGVDLEVRFRNSHIIDIETPSLGLIIEITLNDIIRLITRLAGQEKHTQEELNFTKKVKAQKRPKFDEPHLDFCEPFPKSNRDKENQKSGENLNVRLETLLKIKRLQEKDLKSNLEEKRELAQQMIKDLNLQIDCLETIKED